MLKNRRTDILHSPLFLLSLGVLLLNDWYLKHQFHNWLTGKLSDIAGLMVIFLFAYAFFPKQAKALLVILAGSFIIWKSPYSQWFIDLWNNLAPFNIGRTVDYTDLLALPVLLLAWYYAEGRRSQPTKKIWLSLIVFCSVFAITGTSKLTEEDIQRYEKIEKVHKEYVSTYTFKPRQLDPNIRSRLEKLIFTLPDQKILNQRNIKVEDWVNEAFTAITYEFPQFYVYTWVYHEKPETPTEYNISPREKCDQQLALTNDKDVGTFLGASIKFSREENGVRIELVNIKLCDIPEKKTTAQALEYFVKNFIGRIEREFYP